VCVIDYEKKFRTPLLPIRIPFKYIDLFRFGDKKSVQKRKEIKQLYAKSG